MTKQARGPSSWKHVAPRLNCIIDSGAFSAWTLGKPIKLDNYCDYLLANLDWIGPYVALDVISPGDPEESARLSFENLLYMHSRGLRPIPVYHVGEDVSWLFKMLDLKCDYVGISASSLVSRNKVDEWYAIAWSHLVDSTGRPIVKTHAFGEGRYDSIKRFPWFSADSASWIYAAGRNGQIMLESGHRLSMRNDGGAQASMPDIDDLPELDGEIFDELVRSNNINPEVFKTRDQLGTLFRMYLTAQYYIRVQADVRAKQPILHRPRGFLNQSYHTPTGIDMDPFRMHLVCGTLNMAYSLLAYLEHQNILISYFYIGHFKRLRDYVLEPTRAASTLEPWAKYWQQLVENINES